MAMHSFFADHPAPLAISHSGDVSGGAKSGSLESYQLAHDKGFRCFQVDVVALANGELLSSHAITGRKRRWEDSSVGDLRAQGKHFDTIDEILDAVPDSWWNFEIKSMFATSALIDLLIRRPETASRFLISSPFRPAILRDLSAGVGPDLALAASLIGGGLIGVRLWPTRIPAHAVQLWKPLVRSQWVIDRCAARDIHVQVWSVNKRGQIAHYLDRGVPGIISDDHDLLRESLSARGAWRTSGLITNESDATLVRGPAARERSEVERRDRPGDNWARRIRAVSWPRRSSGEQS